MKIKISCLLISLIILTGCSANYKLEITKDKIIEDFTYTQYVDNSNSKESIYQIYNEWYPAFDSETYPEVPIKVERNHYHEKKYTDLDNGYQFNYNYSFPISQYKDSRLLNMGFYTNNAIINGNILILSTGNKMNAFDQIKTLDSVNVEIVTSLEVVNHNADSVSGTSYFWNFNRSNYTNKFIRFEVSLAKKNESSSQNSNSSTVPDKNDSNPLLYIVFSIGAFLIALVFLIRYRNKKLN